MGRLPEVFPPSPDTESQQPRRLDLGRLHVGHVHRDVEREQVDVLADVSIGFGVQRELYTRVEIWSRSRCLQSKFEALKFRV